jgi:hypothetical protein
MVAWVAIGLLAGAANVEAASSAGSSEPAVLMRLAFPGWQPTGAKSVREIALPPEKTPTGTSNSSERASFSLAPSLLMNLAQDRVVLVVTGALADAKGNSLTSHSSPALLGAYWFEKRGDRWFKVAEQPAFALTGFLGDPGTLRQLDMGGGRIALAVENGSCWQGSCAEFLALYSVGEKKIKRVFRNRVSSNCEEATISCNDLMSLKVGQRKRVPLEDYSTNYGCYHIEGRWDILPTADGPGQLVVEYSGKQTSAKTVPVSPPTGKAARAAKAQRRASDAPTEEYMVTITEVRTKQVYSFSNGRYILIEGKNPNPGI